MQKTSTSIHDFHLASHNPLLSQVCTLRQTLRSLLQSGVACQVRIPGDGIQVNLYATTATQTDPTNCVDILSQLSTVLQLEVMSKFFSEYTLVNFNLTIPDDFLLWTTLFVHNRCYMVGGR